MCEIKMKIIITGSSGFIGNHLSRYLSENHEILGIDCNSVESPNNAKKFINMKLPNERLAKIIRSFQPDVLIHTAGPANVGQSMVTPLADFENSVLVWAHILEQIRNNHRECRVIFLSSAAVYGNPIKLPVPETHPTDPVSPYGYHKLMCEKLSKYYSQLYGLSICNLRIFSAYGQGLRRQVIWDICRKVISSNIIELMGTGEEKRDFVEIEDIILAIEKILLKGEFQGNFYNVASGIGTSISDLARVVVEAFGEEKEIVFSGDQRPGDPDKWQADISCLLALGYSPSITLQNGIERIVKWFLADQAG